jgi:hypothetical protein
MIFFFEAYTVGKTPTASFSFIYQKNNSYLQKRIKSSSQREKKKREREKR